MRGMGARTPGALGPGGVREKDVVLAIAQRLKKKFDATLAFVENSFARAIIMCLFAVARRGLEISARISSFPFTLMPSTPPAPGCLGLCPLPAWRYE